ncbi:unnamed protein product [Durusdinium trenchii]|uniref:dCTP pyrophosphatase 1 n=1 Tax=Durusdinium trenchii TaxID=1381693 RepID=A0ABP0RSE3_9DINO
MSSNGESDPSSEVIAALTKQLGVDAAAVERAFRAGVSHAETMAKRRRVGENLSEASRSKGAEEVLNSSSRMHLLLVATHLLLVAMHLFLVNLLSLKKHLNGSSARYTCSTILCHRRLFVQETSGIKFSEGISFEQLRQELAEFAKERDWDQFHQPRNLALALVGEVGELCECFQWKGEVEEGLPGWSDKHRTAVRQEIADVLLYLIRLSHKCHIDLPKAALDKLAVNAAKYPAGLVRGSSRKYTEYTVNASA